MDRTVDVEKRDVTLGSLNASVMVPKQASGAGVLVLPSVHGIDDPVRDYAAFLAQEGFTALIWDPYSGQQPITSREDRVARSEKLSDQGSLREMSRWIDYMQSELAVSRIGVLGFCLGGRYSLLLGAHERRLDSCVAYYPTIETPRLRSQELDAVPLCAEMDCPVLMITAGIDHLTSHGTFLELQAKLQRRARPSVIQFHPEAEHGFMQIDKRPGEANRSAVRLSRLQALAFLKGTLG